MTHNEENYQSIEKDPEMTQVIELVDKHTKIVIKIYYIHKKDREKCEHIRKDIKRGSNIYFREAKQSLR